MNMNKYKLLTYNIFLRPPLIRNNKNDYKNERLSEFYQVMNRFDIICLQEVFGFMNNRKEQLIKYAMECGYTHNCWSPKPRLFTP